jgi:homoserine/homoserine lactone efflux protein
MTLHTWMIYLFAVVGLSLTPGPNSLLVITHGALHGHRRALFTVSGGAIGFIALIALSMLGIGAVLQASAGALTVLKLLGGAYLIWLGVQLWRAPAIHIATDAARADSPGVELFRKGLLAAVTNPKVLLFYGAFLPQFVDPAYPLLGQFLIMAATFALVECVVEYLLARLAHRISPGLERLGRRFNRLCGGMFITMGTVLPMTR